MAIEIAVTRLRIGPEKYGLGWGGMQGRDGMGRGRGGCLRQVLCLGGVECTRDAIQMQATIAHVAWLLLVIIAVVVVVLVLVATTTTTTTTTTHNMG